VVLVSATSRLGYILVSFKSELPKLSDKHMPEQGVGNVDDELAQATGSATAEPTTTAGPSSNASVIDKQEDEPEVWPTTGDIWNYKRDIATDYSESLLER
jgi:hypothetical protein